MAIQVLLQYSKPLHDMIEKIKIPTSTYYVGKVFSPSNKLPVSADKYLYIVVNNRTRYQTETLNELLRAEAKGLADLLFVTPTKKWYILEMIPDNTPVYDNRQTKPEVFYEYISENLFISETAAKELLSRCNSYEPSVVKAVETLNVFGSKKITTKMVKMFVQKNNNIRIETVYEYLLGYTLFRVKEKDLYDYLYKYRDSLTYIKKKLLEEIEIDLENFRLIINNQIPEVVTDRMRLSCARFTTYITHDSLYMLKLRIQNLNTTLDILEGC